MLQTHQGCVSKKYRCDQFASMDKNNITIQFQGQTITVPWTNNLNGIHACFKQIANNSYWLPTLLLYRISQTQLSSAALGEAPQGGHYLGACDVLGAARQSAYAGLKKSVVPPVVLQQAVKASNTVQITNELLEANIIPYEAKNV